MTVRVLRGVAASPGVASGLGLRCGGRPPAADPSTSPATGPSTGPATDRAVDIAGASRRVVEDLRGRAATVATVEGRQLLGALALIAADPELLAAARRHADAGVALADALRAAAREHADRLRGVGGRIGERADDVMDIGERLAAGVEGTTGAGTSGPGHPYVLVAEELSPADTAVLNPAEVLGIVTERGSGTSHTAILARSLGIPAVVGCVGAVEAVDGRQVVVDGDAGEVHTDTGPELAEQLRQLRRTGQRSRRAGAGTTADKTAVALLANVGSVDEALVAAELDVEGIGLLRTEFLFLDRVDEPGLDEQVELYRRVLAAFAPPRRVVVRTLDAGSDKQLAFLQPAAEPNPALGVRGFRTSMWQPAVLRRQLAAFAAASEQTGAALHVMAPMITTAAEAAGFARLARGAGLRSVGVMVEVPAAALRAADLVVGLDFVSVGTNDLAQYAMAADREQGRLAALLDPWQPAVLDLVAATCAGAQRHDCPVGVCGEAAGDPQLAAVLVGLGVRSLSMAPAAVPDVRDLLGGLDVADCRRAAVAARQASSAPAARDAAAAALSA